MKHIKRLFVLLLLCVLPVMHGCMSVAFGVHPQFNNLNSLQVGISSKADVLLALGEPRGSGIAKVRKDLEPRNIWFYEYVESDGAKVHIEILLVFMLADRYDGHLWFSSFGKDSTKTIMRKSSAKIGSFPAVAALETEFQRGKTTEDQVLAKLGAPTGNGSAIMPPDHLDMKVLYYEQLKIQEMNSNTAGSGEITFDLDQRILLVLIQNGVFEGLMWFANADFAEAKLP